MSSFRFNLSMLKLIASIVLMTYAMSELTVSESFYALCFAGLALLGRSGYNGLTKEDTCSQSSSSS